MPFQQLESLRRRYPQLAEHLSDLARYLEGLLQQERYYDINPVQIQYRLGIDQTRAMLLLRVLDEAGIVRPRYDIICPSTGDLLGSVYSLENLPSTVLCGEHTDHDADEYNVDLRFEFVPAIVEHEPSLAV